MKRSAFLVGLLGFCGIKAKGQDRTCGDNCLPATGGHSQYLRSPGITYSDRPPNGQCPVCATMADPYRRETYMRIGGGKECQPGDTRLTPDVCLIDTGLSNEETARIVRCKACNVAFFQDSEN